jgi:hypothetical protein
VNTNAAAAPTRNRNARYTLAEAESMLPLLRSIAAEISERRDRRRELERQREEFEASPTPEGLTMAMAETDALMFEQSEGLRQALEELKDLNLTVLRLHPVTLHIPGTTVNGELVFCWQEGEDSVAHGHPIGQEQDPRRPLKVRVQKRG